jgi:hypothetical protein
MLEKDIQMKFAKEWHDTLKETLKLDKLRLYAIEFKIRTNDGDKRADLVYEVEGHETPMHNPMFVLELKKDKIDVGVCEQVARYAHHIQLQLYRKHDVQAVIAGPDFSEWELKTCKEQGIHALQFDLKGNMRLVA